MYYGDRYPKVFQVYDEALLELDVEAGLAVQETLTPEGEKVFIVCRIEHLPEKY